MNNIQITILPINFPTGCDSTQSVAISTEKRNSLTRTKAQEQPQLVHKSYQKRTPIPSGPLKAQNSISASQTKPEAEESFFSPSGPEGHHSYHRTFSDIMRTPSAEEESFTFHRQGRVHVSLFETHSCPGLLNSKCG